MSVPRVLRFLVASSALVLSGLAAEARTLETPPQEAPGRQEAAFGESIDVALVTTVVRVVDLGGNPIRGLAPDDVRVRVGKREVPVLAFDWVENGGEAALESPGDVLAPQLPEVARTPADAGRLIVVFVQADLSPTRLSGQLRLRPYTRELLGTFAPQDRVAVVSFDAHLKIWQDFSPDVAATHRAIDRAMLWGDDVAIEPALPYSLRAGIADLEARAAATPERALEVVARALAPLPGEKTVLFLGWGLGRFGSFGVTMPPGFKPAVAALRAAHASVFVLDVTSADEHSLAAGLESVAEATGGLYFSTFRLPQLAARTLARTLSGYYLLTLDRTVLADLTGDLRIDLRRRNGTVLTQPLTVR